MAQNLFCCCLLNHVLKPQMRRERVFETELIAVKCSFVGLGQSLIKNHNLSNTTTCSAEVLSPPFGSKGNTNTDCIRWMCAQHLCMVLLLALQSSTGLLRCSCRDSEFHLFYHDMCVVDLKINLRQSDIIQVFLYIFNICICRICQRHEKHYTSFMDHFSFVHRHKQAPYF